MNNSLLVNNMYAAYSATSKHVDQKSVSDLSKMLKTDGKKKDADSASINDKEIAMDKVIISSEALQMLKVSGF